MRMIKSEDDLRRSHTAMVGCAVPEGTVSVKRRKRDVPADVIKCDSQPREKQVETTFAATTTKRSSRFRGVSKHRWTGRYEAHLWDKLSWNANQKKKGKQGV